LFSKYFLSVTLVHCIQTAKDSLPSDIILGPVAPSINFWKRSYSVSKNLVCWASKRGWWGKIRNLRPIYRYILAYHWPLHR